MLTHMQSDSLKTDNRLSAETEQNLRIQFYGKLIAETEQDLHLLILMLYKYNKIDYYRC